MSQTNYSRRLCKATWRAFLVPTAVAVPLGYSLRYVAPGDHFWLVMLGGLFVVGTALWASIPWWRTMDDMQRHGHLLSWLWGGSALGLFMLVWLIAALGMEAPQVQGALALMVAQTVGYLAFWAVWMWRQRGDKS